MKTIGPDPYSTKTSHNPFAAPRARVADPDAQGSGALLDPPRTVGAGRGFGWLGEGWTLFREAPGTWIGVIVVWLLVSIVIGLIPLVNVLSNLIYPVFAGGLMVGCHSLAQGQGLTLNHLFEGFRRNFGTLVLIGLFSLIATLVVVGGAFLGIVGTSGAVGILLEQDASATPDPMLILVAVLVVFALLIPLMMALWFAPALAILHNVPALRAMGLSFRGCLRNLLPFLAYGLGGLGLGILAMIPLGLGWLVLMPVLIASTYAAYRDLFVD
jgi:uncharacterized membrane protein